MKVQTKAIVLRIVKYGDNKQVVEMLTENYGRQTFSVSISTTGRGRMKAPFFQPLSMLEIVFDLRPNRSMLRLADVRMSRPFTTIHTDFVKLSLALFIGEFLRYATRNEQQNALLFGFVAASLEWLDEAHGGLANFHLVFMMRLARFLGFYPNLEAYAPSAWFDLREGEFLSVRPLHPDVVAPKDARLIPILARLDYRSMCLLSLSRAERGQCLRTLITYYQLHIPEFPEMKSVGVLSDLFE